MVNKELNWIYLCQYTFNKRGAEACQTIEQGVYPMYCGFRKSFSAKTHMLSKCNWERSGGPTFFFSSALIFVHIN